MEKQCECQCGCDTILLVTFKHYEGNALVTTKTFMLEDATDYAKCTDYIFGNNITFERLRAWQALSNRMYTILPDNELDKMRTLFKNRCASLYKRVNLPLKVLLIIWYGSWVLFK